MELHRHDPVEDVAGQVGLPLRPLLVVGDDRRVQLLQVLVGCELVGVCMCRGVAAGLRLDPFLRHLEADAGAVDVFMDPEHRRYHQVHLKVFPLKERTPQAPLETAALLGLAAVPEGLVADLPPGHLGNQHHRPDILHGDGLVVPLDPLMLYVQVSDLSVPFRQGTEDLQVFL